MKSKKTVSIIVGLILFFLVSGIVIYLINDDTAYVFVEVNPNIQFVLNRKNKVVEVNALNEEAKDFLKDTKLKSKTLEKASQEVSSKLAKSEYVSLNTKNIIMINTVSSKEKRNKKLNSTVEKIIKKEFDQEDLSYDLIVGATTELIKERAEKLNIAPGKMFLIHKAINLGSKQSEKELAVKSIKDIQKEIKNLID